jgi:hypothetical protein
VKNSFVYQQFPDAKAEEDDWAQKSLSRGLQDYNVVHFCRVTSTCSGSTVLLLPLPNLLFIPFPLFLHCSNCRMAACRAANHAASTMKQAASCSPDAINKKQQLPRDINNEVAKTNQAKPARIKNAAPSRPST